MAQRDERGKRVVNADGQTLYSFRFQSVDLSGYMIVKEGPLYKVKRESESRGMRASTKDLLERLPPRPGLVATGHGGRPLGLGGGGGGSGAAAGAESAATGLADQLAQLTAKFELQQEAQTAIAGELATLARAVEAVARAPPKLTA